MARILIAEDSPTQMEGLRQLVEGMGHYPLSACDGEEAVAMAIRHKPDLILMDVLMPKSNGFQATRALVRNPSTTNIPIIILSTKANETDRIWGLRQGAKAYLTKPFQAADLIEMVKKLLPE